MSKTTEQNEKLEWVPVKGLASGVNIRKGQAALVFNNSFLETSHVNGGIVRVKPGGFVKSLIVNYGTLVVEGGATAEYVTMKKGSHLIVYTDGVIRDLIMWGEIHVQIYPGATIEMMHSKAKDKNEGART